MDKLDEFFKLKEEIFNYFGYKEQYRKFPLEDTRDCFWYIQGNVLRYAETLEVLRDVEAGQYWEANIYTQRHLTKWVYRTDHHTMALVDTHCDLNIYLVVLDNSKEVKDIY